MPEGPVTVIGLTGSIGSGCSYVYHQFLEPRGYRLIRLSDILRSEYMRENPEATSAEQIATDVMQSTATIYGKPGVPTFWQRAPLPKLGDSLANGLLIVSRILPKSTH